MTEENGNVPINDVEVVEAGSGPKVNETRQGQLGVAKLAEVARKALEEADTKAVTGANPATDAAAAAGGNAAAATATAAGAAEEVEAGANPAAATDAGASTQSGTEAEAATDAAAAKLEKEKAEASLLGAYSDAEVNSVPNDVKAEGQGGQGVQGVQGGKAVNPKDGPYKQEINQSILDNKFLVFAQNNVSELDKEGDKLVKKNKLTTISYDLDNKVPAIGGPNSSEISYDDLTRNKIFGIVENVNTFKLSELADESKKQLLESIFFLNDNELWDEQANEERKEKIFADAKEVFGSTIKDESSENKKGDIEKAIFKTKVSRYRGALDIMDEGELDKKCVQALNIGVIGEIDKDPYICFTDRKIEVQNSGKDKKERTAEEIFYSKDADTDLKLKENPFDVNDVNNATIDGKSIPKLEFIRDLEGELKSNAKIENVNGKFYANVLIAKENDTATLNISPKIHISEIAHAKVGEVDKNKPMRIETTIGKDGKASFRYIIGEMGLYDSKGNKIDFEAKSFDSLAALQEKSNEKNLDANIKSILEKCANIIPHIDLSINVNRVNRVVNKENEVIHEITKVLCNEAETELEAKNTGGTPGTSPVAPNANQSMSNHPSR